MRFFFAAPWCVVILIVFQSVVLANNPTPRYNNYHTLHAITDGKKAPVTSIQSNNHLTENALRHQNDPQPSSTQPNGICGLETEELREKKADISEHGTFNFAEKETYLTPLKAMTSSSYLQVPEEAEFESDEFKTNFYTQILFMNLPHNTCGELLKNLEPLTEDASTPDCWVAVQPLILTIEPHAFLKETTKFHALSPNIIHIFIRFRETLFKIFSQSEKNFLCEKAQMWMGSYKDFLMGIIQGLEIQRLCLLAERKWLLIKQKMPT